MKNNIIITLLAAVTYISLSLYATPLVLQNYHEKKVDYKLIKNDNSVITGTLGYGAGATLCELKDIHSLEIKGIGLYSSLNFYVDRLKRDQKESNNTSCPWIIIDREQSITSKSWNISLTSRCNNGIEWPDDN